MISSFSVLTVLFLSFSVLQLVSSQFYGDVDPCQLSSVGGWKNGTQSFDGIDLVLLFGPTGSGKSTYGNLASGSEFVVGHGLKSCTSAVQFSAPFELNGRTIVLIDTPGFDDTRRSEMENLKVVTEPLTEIYKGGKNFTGVIYFHRIFDNRVGGSTQRIFDMFREFCGASTYENVALVTNMWETIDKSDGERREHELATEESFFAPMIQGGARLMRHNNTLETAQDILLHLLSKQPRPFAVVEDIVDGNLSFGDTGAGNIIKKGSHTETVTQTEVFTHTAVATHTVVHTSPPGPTRRCTKVNVLGIVKWSRCK